MLTATALRVSTLAYFQGAHPNIAFIKYWGNRDDLLRLPSNGSISMNLDGLFTRTTVTFPAPADSLVINGKPVTGPGLHRVISLPDPVRGIAGIDARAQGVSWNIPSTLSRF